MKTIVRTPSRIHFGLLDMKGGLRRMYGSIGVALDYPYTVVEVSDHDSFEVEGGDPRAKEYARKIREYFGIERGMKISVLKSIPPHVGLGSGTQLALGIGIAILRHSGRDASVESLAKLLGRGKRSGVGIYSFKLGGLILDGGVGEGDVPVLIARYEFPEDWLFVVGIPNIDRGYAGPREDTLLRELTEKLNRENYCSCETLRVLVYELLPSLIKRDIEGFGKALMKLELEVGKMFAPVQSGVFRSPVIEKGVEVLLNSGAYGAGQSSWGPTFYGLVDEDNSKKVLNNLREFLNSSGGGTAFVTRANNSGARIISF